MISSVRLKLLFVAAIGGLLSACRPQVATYQTLSAEAEATPIVLRGGRLIDGSGGPPIGDAVLVLDGQSIRAVGSAGEVPVPSDAHVIDLRGMTIVPGLVSNHSHLGMVDGVESGQGLYTRQNVLRQLEQFEAYGVTTVTSLGLNDALFYELQSELHRGVLPGADIFGADRGIGVPSGAPPLEVGPSQLYRAETPREGREAVRASAQRRPDLLKIWVDDFHGSLPSKMAPEVYTAVIDEAHHQGLRVAAHAFYLEDARRLVEAGVDVLAHGVRDRDVDDAFVASMIAHGTWYVPTLGLDETAYAYAEAPPWSRTPFFRHAVQPALAAQIDDRLWRKNVLADAARVAVDKQALATNLRNVKRLHDAGVKLGFGADSGATPLRLPGFAEHREVKLMTRAGIAPVEAIGIATRRAASLLGLADRGVLAPGKLADFFVVSGDPATNIDDLDRITAVWHRGRRVREGISTFKP